MGQSQKCGRGRRQITGFSHLLFIKYLLTRVGLPGVAEWRGGQINSPQKQLQTWKKLVRTTILAPWKSTDQRHRIIWEVFVLEQLLKFSNNSGTLWHPCLRMLPFSSPLPSPVSMEILPGWGDAVRTGSFAATVKEGSLELEQERANGTTNRRLQLWLGEEYSWLRLCTLAAENRGSKIATYS